MQRYEIEKIFRTPVDTGSTQSLAGAHIMANIGKNPERES